MTVGWGHLFKPYYAICLLVKGVDTSNIRGLRIQ
jgi:hypothetical protein